MLDYTQLLITYGLPLLFPLVIGSMGTCVLLSAKKARFIPHFLFGVYVCCLCYVTLCRASVYDSSVHFQVFSAWRLAWNTFSFQNWINLLLNVALLVPFGILFPLVFPKARRWTVPAGLALSLLIEFLQLLTHRGICDVDDLLCNTLGCAMGFGLLYFCQNIRRSPRRAWAGAVPALLPLLCGVFLVESFSVMMQVGYFKYTKRKFGEGQRLLLMAPVHHHFQKKGQFETKIVLRFWIISLLLAAITLVTLKIR